MVPQALLLEQQGQDVLLGKGLPALGCHVLLLLRVESVEQEIKVCGGHLRIANLDYDFIGRHSGRACRVRHGVR